MKQFSTIVLVILVYFLSPSHQNVRHGDPPEFLHVYTDADNDEGRSSAAPHPRSIVLMGDEASDYLTRIKRSNTAKDEKVNNDNKAKPNSDVGGELAKLSTQQTASSADGERASSTTSPSNVTATTPSSVSSSSSSNSQMEIINGNITVNTNRLNDSHAQLMVHWLGEGTNVMICLAREPPPLPFETSVTAPSPSSVFISYDYGDTFQEKTADFKIKINGTEIASTLDQFVTHPKFPSRIVFTDPRNKVIFTSDDFGRTIKSHNVEFKPSDVAFYDADSKTFLVHDKDDAEKKLYYTTDFGVTFTILQQYVKSFVWSSGEGMPAHLYVERAEPTNTSSVIFMDAAQLIDDSTKNNFNLLIERVQDFNIKKNFMFATRKVLNNTQLLISYKRQRFVKADFQTVLDIKGLHIADVEGKRIMVSAVHSEVLTHLYVSESDNDMTDIKFVPSLENVFTYVPNLTWLSSWLVQTSDEAFTDLYKVEGLRGIYIASKQNRLLTSKTFSITPEHLVSVITYDHGSTWNPIKAPSYDDEGMPINCTRDCSLHLSQKFSLLYPVTRSVSIMSSKSAPGVIMASGVMGKSLKGHAGVFISRDAGITWKQILKTYHFFNIGDHGGILVAVKYFKSKGETYEILYSTNEGENWQSAPFHATKLKVYGLMKEPNANKTVFTLFGSEPEQHSWLIIKVDLRNAFSGNCTAHDYKFWTPGSQQLENVKPCLLGKQETYQRRIPHANCYNGEDFERVIKSETCMCNAWDFECDYGYSRLNQNEPCIRNKTIKNFDPYQISPGCIEGAFYVRTKGYRKIEGDVCEDGYLNQYLPEFIPCPVAEVGEFLIVAQRDAISRINLLNKKKDILPVKGLRNVIAIDFDLKNNCVFWADIMADVIGRQCLDGNGTSEHLVDTNLASVEGMSYDWISQLLFFVDGTRIKIEAVKTSHEGLGMRFTIIKTQYLSKPRGIVVHPKQGYLFWTDWSSISPSLSRSNLDGSNIKQLFTKPEVVWPNGVTIDYIAERVFWVDASKDYIASCDLNGKQFKTIIKQDARVAHPFAVAVFKDLMYWDDWKMNSIFTADKDEGIMTQVIAEDMSSLMDLKIFAHSIQEGGNGCADGKKCQYGCVGAPKNNYTCLCPDGMERTPKGECLCPGGFTPTNKTCPQHANTCGPSYFTCTNKLCVPLLYRCDNEDDCGDNSDEKGCIDMKPPCPPHMFTCKSNHKCIPDYFHCDHDKDCADGSDEQECDYNQCNSSEFYCANGRCISKIWRCDGEDDCRDGSDEKNCTKNVFTAHQCRPNQFKCKASGACIPNDWVCDSDEDCSDMSDEKDCKSTEACDPWMFACGDGHCINNAWKCDGDQDCENGADEKNCSTKVPQRNRGEDDNIFPVCFDWMFKCANSKCIPYWWKCDHVDDCGDASDEFGCTNTNTTKGPSMDLMPSKPTKPTVAKCELNEFRCDTGLCIASRYVCDGIADCMRGEDEEACFRGEKNCGFGKFRCRSDGHCLPREKYCDKVVNCFDGSDEEDCEKHPNNKPDAPTLCRPGYFGCDNNNCFPLSKICDGKTDCYDGSDEKACNETSRRVYQATHVGVDERSINETSFILTWWISVPSNIILEFMPAMSIVGSDIWQNHTRWLNGLHHHYYNLKPFTNYNLTVFVRISNRPNDIFIPYFYTNVTTAEGVPTEPLNITATQVNGSRIRVNWSPPLQTYGTLISYSVYYQKESIQVEPSTSVKVSPQELSVVLDSSYEPNKTYLFWVKAKNSKHESPASKMVRLTFDNVKNLDNLQGLSIQSHKADSVTLIWDPVKTAEGYLIQPVLPQSYPRINPERTNATTITLTHLVPGTQYIFKVSAYKKDYYGRSLNVPFDRSSSGPQLPPVPIEGNFQDNGIVTLRWKAPSTNYGLITYGIYYGTSTDELNGPPKVTTTALEAHIKDIDPCESYLFAVGITGPVGPGPLPRNPKIIETPPNHKKPPKNLDVKITKSKEMIIKWEKSCSSPTKQRLGPGHEIIVTELKTNKTSKVTLLPSMNNTLSHTFVDIHDGSKYEVRVASNIQESEAAFATAEATPLPAPRHLQVIYQKNGTYTISWKEMDIVDGINFKYELVAYSGFYIGDSLKPHKTLVVAGPPVAIDPSFFASSSGGDSAPPSGHTYSLGMRIISDNGVPSDVVEVEHIDVTPDALHSSSVAESSMSSLVVILPIIVILLLVGTVFYLFQRHRRSQSSFSRFANSHYDTKTGATRIGDALDEDDHQETPPRFDDDEPLVIA